MNKRGLQKARKVALERFDSRFRGADFIVQPGEKFKAVKVKDKPKAKPKAKPKPKIKPKTKGSRYA